MSSRSVYVVDAVRTPIGKYRGALSRIRTDDLAALSISALLERQAELGARVDQVVFGSTNQAGEDNRNVARMAALIGPGMPYECGRHRESSVRLRHRSHHDGARMIAVGEADVVSSGVESMTRAPYSMRSQGRLLLAAAPPLYDTTLGWRYPNRASRPVWPAEHGRNHAENVAKKFGISREEQARYALESHKRATLSCGAAARSAPRVVKVEVPQPKGAQCFRTGRVSAPGRIARAARECLRRSRRRHRPR